MDDLPLIVLRPLLGETPLNDILGRIAIKGGVRFGSDGKTPQTPAAPASATSLAVTGAEASVSALSFGRGNSLSAADRKAGKDAGSPAVRIRALTFNGLHFDTQARSASVKTLSVEAPEVRVTSSGGMGLAIPGAKPSAAKPASPRGCSPPPCRTPQKPSSPTGSSRPAVSASPGAGWSMSPQGKPKSSSPASIWKQGLFPATWPIPSV